MNFDFFRSHADSPAIHIPAIGLELKVRLPLEASGGGMTIIETVNAPGFGPPLHRHHEAEVFLRENATCCMKSDFDISHGKDICRFSGIRSVIGRGGKCVMMKRAEQ